MSVVSSAHETEAVRLGKVRLKSKEREVYFDFPRNVYWTRTEAGEWLSVNEGQVKRFLRADGISPKTIDGSHVSPLDQKLIQIQQTRAIHYAGPLAGYCSGIHEESAKRILVTDSPKLLEPRQGDWPTLRQLIHGLLVDEDLDQTPYLYGWLKTACEALREEKRRPGQALVLCGPRACGKSLLQNLITDLLGGRSAKPHQFMSGLTSFNGDMFEAEHLMLEDEQSTTDVRSRRSFGAAIKAITVNDTQRCHSKNRQAITLRPFWRLTITLNDESENLQILPPLDESLEDKLILLKANKRPMPMATERLEDRERFMQILRAELPHFLCFLLRWEIPDHLQGARFGVIHFHHPVILESLNSLAPEARLLNLIDSVLFGTPAAGVWEGTAEELESKLTGDGSSCRREARILFGWNTACGVFLGRLAQKHPDRVEQDRKSYRRGWVIRPAK